MAAYVIDFTDPLRPTFQINPTSYDGPGGTQSNSTLRLYGKGALQWGEAVDEDLLRLLENFASATPPLYPNPGQLWQKQELYWRNTSVSVTAVGPAPANAFFRYRFENGSWNTTNSTYPFAVDVVNTLPATGGTIGRYVYNLTDNTLYRWDTPYKQAAAQWMPRAYTAEASNPGAAVPRETLLVYTVSGIWSAISTGGAGGGGGYSTITNLTTPRPLILTDANSLIRYTSATVGNFVIPHSSSIGYPIGTRLSFRQVGAGQVAVQPDTGVTVYMKAGFSVPTSVALGGLIWFTKISADEWEADGDFVYS